MPKYIPTVMRHSVREPNRAMNAKGEWPEDVLAEFLRLMATSMSYGEIANELSRSFPKYRKTRNAVLGKAHRLGLRHGKPSPINPRARLPEHRAGRTSQRTPRAAKPMRQPKRAPVVFKHDDPVMLRPDGDRGVYPTKRTGGRISNEEIAARKAGHLPSIIEVSPLTSRPVHECGKGTCQWPTSEGTASMEVCGSAAKVGAYCERHAEVAYRVMPTAKRNRRFNKEDREYQSVGLGASKIDTGAGDAAWIAANVIDDPLDLPWFLSDA